MAADYNASYFFPHIEPDWNVESKEIQNQKDGAACYSLLYV